MDRARLVSKCSILHFGPPASVPVKMEKPGLSPVTFLLPHKTTETLICDCQVSGLLECAETLTWFKVVCLISDCWNYLFKTSLINAQWQEQCHRLIVNQLEGVMSAWF